MTFSEVGPDVQFGLAINSVGDVVRNAERAEELGFDFLAMGEHVAARMPSPHTLVGLAAAAAVTERIRLLSAVLLLPVYPPALVAKMAAMLDVLSRGRFTMGIGVGGEYPTELAACGIPMNERGARVNEALDVIRRLWTQDEVTFQGQYTTLDHVTLDLKPMQKPYPPIWVSGRQVPAMRRAARFADGWMPYLYTPEKLRKSIETIESTCVEIGRDRGSVRPTIFLSVSCHADRDTALAHALARMGTVFGQDFAALAPKYLLFGTPDECRKRLGEYIDAGATAVIFAPACPDEYLRENERMIVDELIPAYRT